LSQIKTKNNNHTRLHYSRCGHFLTN
jgi:hypothetical protein